MAEILALVVIEMKIDYRPGFRIYYGIVDDEIIMQLMVGSIRTQKGVLKKQMQAASLRYLLFSRRKFSQR